MRILIALVALASVAHAEPIHPQLTVGFARFGAAHIDGTSGVAVGFNAEGRIVNGSFSVGLEAGVTGVLCDEPCHSSDISFALHARHRIKKLDGHPLWFGGGPALHRTSTSVEVAARGETIERTRVRWQPGFDLLLGIELRDRKGGVMGGHLGVRAFALRSDESHGIDGGLLIETGYVLGR